MDGIDTAWIAFGAAIVGALVGGFAAGVGSWLLSRTEHKREQRVTMLADQIPAFVAELRAGRRSGTPVTAEVVAAAHALALRAASTRSEGKYADRIVVALAFRDVGLSMYGPQDAHGGYPITEEGREQARQAEAVLIAAVQDLEQHLLAKLSGRRD